MVKSRHTYPQPQPAPFVLSAIVIAIPFLVTCWLVYVYLDRSMTGFVPQSSDGIGHWHQVATFRAAGFNGGYYTVNEQPASVPNLHFSAHGPMYPLILGTLTAFSGWHLNSPIFVNLAVLTVSIALFIWYVRPNTIQSVFTGLTLLTCLPLHLYMASSMREVVIAAFLIFAATLLWDVCIRSYETTFRRLMLLFVVLLVLTLLKATNALLLLPAFLAARYRLGITAVWASCLAGLFMVIFSFSSLILCAPYPSYLSGLSDAFSRSLREGVLSLTLHAAENTKNFFSIEANPLWILVRAQMLLASIAGGWMLWRAHGKGITVLAGITILTASAGTAVAAIFLYDVYDWKDYRLFFPFVLMIAFLLIAQKRFMLVALMIAGNMALLPHFLDTYKRAIAPAFPEQQTIASIQAFAAQLTPVMPYDEKRNGWQNTLLIPLSLVEERLLLGVPPGIGISFFFSPDYLGNVKSRYLLLDRKSYMKLSPRVALEQKLTTPIGNLYINLTPGPIQ